jgi:hypothetical protein
MSTAAFEMARGTHDQTLDYERIARELFSKIEAGSKEVLLFDEFGNVPSSVTATVSTVPIAGIYTSLGSYRTAGGITAAISPFAGMILALPATSSWIHCSPSVSDVESRFKELAAEWKRDTMHFSRVDDMSAHPAYQEIIAMGWTAVPLILKEMKRERNHWFVALSQITRADPLPERRHATVKEMTDAWIAWGKKHVPKERSDSRK